jgi:hypothetical protein
MTRFAAYIPVGPSVLDLPRVQDLLESLAVYEPSLELVLLFDHGPHCRDFSMFKSIHPRANVIEVRTFSQENNSTWLGSGVVANLTILDMIARICDIEFVVKLDTDALVIAPFSDQLGKCFAGDQSISIAGTLGSSSNRDVRSLNNNQVTRIFVKTICAIGTMLAAGQPLDNLEIVRWNLFTNSQIDSFRKVSSEIDPLATSEFTGDHCQGGAYAFSRSFVSRMKAAGYLDKPLRWQSVPLGEDKVMGMYSSLLGMKLRDFSGEGEPFGIQDLGLPYSPDELIARKHCIVHSLRRDPRYNESSLREQFRFLRDRG